MINKVREARTEKGLTQQALADRVRVSRQTIISVETARYMPTTVLALKLARELGQTVEELFALEEND